MYIYLTRHGETLWNLQGKTQGSKDIPLSVRGIRQSEILAERLKEENITKIYTSGLKRAFRTASIIGAKLDIQTEIKYELNEINFGIWESMTRQEIEKSHPDKLKEFRLDFEFAPEGGETLASLQRRIQDFLDYLKSNEDDSEKRILVVAHAYPIRMLIMEMMGLPKGHLWSYQLSNCGISVIRTQPPYLLCLNDTAHLSKTDSLANLHRMIYDK
jgi:broad specificity phosphatase PhoE